MLALAIVALFALQGDPAISEETPMEAPAEAVVAPPPVKTAAERDKEVVCVDYTPMGTLMSKKVCHTRKQWRKMQERSRRNVDETLTTPQSDRPTRE